VLCGERQVFERAIPSPDGNRVRHSLAEYIPDLSGGVVQGFFVQVADITPVKEAHAALHASEEKLRSLYELSPLGIGLCEMDGRFVSVNAAFCQLCGYTEAELKTLDYWALTPPEYAPQEAQQLAALASTGRYGPYEKEYLHKDGRRVAAQLNGVLVTDPDGAQRIWSIVEDISDHRAKLLELTRAKEAAEVANRAKSRFLSHMSHELRTPMNAVLGMLDLLKGTQLNLQQLDYAEKSESAARSLLDLLNDILDFSKVEAGMLALETQPFRLEQLLRELAIILSANVARKPIEVLFDVDPRTPEVLAGDMLRLKQVLINLSGNALKFTRTGEVVVSVNLQSADADSVTLEFAVSDTGIGIAADMQAQIFEAFTQAEAGTARQFGGTGLGLAISRALVALMGGELQVQSTPGVGSRFYFSVPLRRVQPVPPELQAPPVSLPQPLEVLVVDDNPVACRLLVALLTSRGVTASGADSGGTALQLMQQRMAQQQRPFDLVLLDWQMPAMDGWETARQISTLKFGHHRAPHLIMISANGRAMLAQRSAAEQASLHGFLAKPVSPAMLLEAIASACAGPRSGWPSARPAGQRGLERMRILVVEDNLLNQQVAQELLSREGALVTLAGNGQQGVDAVAAADTPFDVVLMDLQMPVLDGYAATRQIRQDMGQNTLPIIAMSANVMSEDVAQSRAAGMTDHVGKPFKLAQLVGLLRRHVGWSALAESNAKPSAPPLLAQTPPSAPESLDALGKIDFATALEWCGDDTTLYRQFAHSFVRDIADHADRLAQHLARGEQRDAVRILHTLKGLSATIGANQLADFAAKQEAALKQAALAPAGVDALVQQIRDGIAAVSVEVLRIVESINATLD